MAGSRVQVNKAHKSRFASKASRQVHRTSRTDKSRISKPDPHGVVKGARAARVQRSKMVRDQKRAALLKEKRATSGSASPPRVIVLFGLSASVKINLLAKDLLTSLSPEGTEPTSTTVASPTYKLRTTILEAPHGDLLSCMEMVKAADLIAFVASGSSLYEGGESGSFMDSFGSQCLSVFRALGLPSTVVLIRDLPADLKKRNDMKKLCSSSLASEFPEDCKFYPVDTKEELHKFMWLFKEQRLSVPHWRNHRPYLMAQEVDLVADEANTGKSTLLMSGYVRAHSLSVNQLVHVSGAGDFQLAMLDILKDPFPINGKKDRDSMDSDGSHSVQVIRSLLPDPSKQEPLLVENILDPLAGEQTWPTEAEMVEADAVNKRKMLKKKTLPRGTSEYQAAWIVEDTDDEDSDGCEDHGDGMVLDEGQNDRFAQEGNNHSDLDDDEGSVSFSMREFDEETEADTAMTDGENLTREQIEVEIQKIKEAHAEDEEFPDEVDTPLDIPARKRFAKYRGLKSFRTSSWDPKESLPPDYARIFAFDNFARTQKHVLAKALDIDQGSMDDCVPVGTYVRLHIKQVPVDAASKLCMLFKTLPLLVCGLLQHESKMSVLHFSIKKHDSYDAPIKSKESLIFHVGFRQFIARPIFSSDNINSEKHKMERFLHEGCFSIASVYAPISFPSLPLIVLKSGHGEVAAPAVAAVGSLRSVDPDRIILKKIILTGYPQRVSKLKATVRFMFHHPEDVRWFKPVDVWTKCGRRGRVKEPVGTHGAMKCVFNGVVQQHDTVCMSLYKRAFPKWPEQLVPILNA
ncbi:uncharacterized protein LOC131237058 [Magnolia sinica]|uniref:uncharacterized protein LOC131237058 n=1 Tax=Magnolia sinica TaxID=86752 RepID=UPI00265B3BF4|nr:uncharacterized protein LOC131237058 [Magnolia sinica]